MAVRSGIVAAGSFIVDRVKVIESWPPEETLTSITQNSTAPGGAAFNVLVDLARLGARFPLSGIGLVGADADGCFVRDTCSDLGIGVASIHETERAATSYTDVMTVASTGRRTFFHYRGASSLLDLPHFSFESGSHRHLHLGYLLLLETLDQPDREFGTRAGRVLAAASNTGMTTSVDVVSEHSDRFRDVVMPTMPWTDIAFMNETEAAACTGLACRGSNGLDREAVHAAAARILQAGVRQSVVIHAPEGALLLMRDGQAIWQDAALVSQVKGAAGAGDAFAAGFLYGYHEGEPPARCMLFGACSAAASLSAVDATSGVRHIDECLALAGLG